MIVDAGVIVDDLVDVDVVDVDVDVDDRLSCLTGIGASKCRLGAREVGGAHGAACSTRSVGLTPT